MGNSAHRAGPSRASSRGRTVRRLVAASLATTSLAIASLVSGGGAVAATTAQAAAGEPIEIVLSGENNRLNAYDARTGEKRTVIPSAADAPGVGLDINAEICVVPDFVSWKPAGEIWFIAGEDTEQNAAPGVIKQGWGIFRLDGSTLDELSATEVAKFVPDSFVTQGDNPENYGCGVLPDGRVVTGDVGDQLPQDPATGQLIQWFIDESHLAGSIGPDRNDFPRIPHCKIDVTIGTAGGIAIDGTDVLIASNRPDLQGAQSGGILRYDTSIWPRGETAAEGCGRQDSTGAALADADQVGRSLFIPQVVGLTVTPSDIVHSGRDSYYVSSVFTGQVAEYGLDGIFRGFPVFTTGQLGGITPFGLAVTSDGTLWIADIGVEGAGPADGQGSIVRVALDGSGAPGTLEVIDEGLEFPDGLGVVVLPGSASPGPVTPPESPDATTTPVASPTAARQGALPATGGSTVAAGLALAAMAGVLLGRRHWVS